jgi:hypothetical protein
MYYVAVCMCWEEGVHVWRHSMRTQTHIWHTFKVGQNPICMPYMPIYLMKPLQETPYTHHIYIYIYMALANPTYVFMPGVTPHTFFVHPGLASKNNTGHHPKPETTRSVLQNRLEFFAFILASCECRQTTCQLDSKHQNSFTWC